MKKSVLLTLTPPKLTKQLREQAEKDIPVIDNVLRSILFDTVICRIRKIKISHF